MESLKLIEPLKARVGEIQESLYKRNLLEAGDENIFYGTFDNSYRAFYVDNLRDGRAVIEIDFFSSVIAELNKIENAVLEIEKKWNAENQSSTKYHSIFSNIHNIKEEAKKMINNYSSGLKLVEVKSKPKRIKNKLTYKWLLKYQEINTLYKLLKRENYIDKVTKYSDFEFIFMANSFTKISNPIIWKSSNATELLYFITQLIENDIIAGKDKQSDYVLLKECFVDIQNEKFDVVFKTLKTDIKDKLDIDKQILIDKVIQELLK